MYKISIDNRDGSKYDDIVEFDWSSVETNEVNTFTIFQYDENLFNKILRFYKDGELLYTGIIKNISILEDDKEYKITTYPLAYDLKQGFYEDVGDSKLVFKNTTLKEILEDIITQYRAEVTDPLVSIGDIDALGINIEYTFKYRSYLEALNKLYDYLDDNSYIRVNPDGSVDLKDTSPIERLVYQREVSSIDTSIETDEIVNHVVFDNLATGNFRIVKEYSDIDSINQYGKQVNYVKESNITTETGADKLVDKYLKQNKDPKVTINQISSHKDVPLFSKLRIDNWDKKIEDNLYVKSKIYNKVDSDGDNTLVNLVIGTKATSRNVLNTATDIANNVADRKIQTGTVPSYITETKITSTTVESPTISGNDGLFSNQFKVGIDGIEIDGVEKTISSANYDPDVSGWQIDYLGNSEFNNITARGDITATSFSIDNWETDASGTGLPEANADVTANNTAANTTKVNNTFASVVETGAAAGSSAKSVTDVAFNSSNRYQKWLDANDINESRTTTSYTGVLMDSNGLAGYNNGSRTFQINNSTGSAYFEGDIGAANITGSTSISTGGSLLVDNGNGESIELTNESGFPKIKFEDDNSMAAEIYGDNWTATIGDNTYNLSGLKCDTNIITDNGLIAQIGIFNSDVFVVDDIVFADSDDMSTLKWENAGLLGKDAYIHVKNGNLKFFDGSTRHTIV